MVTKKRYGHRQEHGNAATVGISMEIPRRQLQRRLRKVVDVEFQARVRVEELEFMGPVASQHWGWQSGTGLPRHSQPTAETIPGRKDWAKEVRDTQPQHKAKTSSFSWHTRARGAQCIVWLNSQERRGSPLLWDMLTTSMLVSSRAKACSKPTTRLQSRVGMVLASRFG